MVCLHRNNYIKYSLLLKNFHKENNRKNVPLKINGKNLVPQKHKRIHCTEEYTIS